MKAIGMRLTHTGPFSLSQGFQGIFRVKASDCPLFHYVLHVIISITLSISKKSANGNCPQSTSIDMATWTAQDNVGIRKWRCRWHKTIRLTMEQNLIIQSFAKMLLNVLEIRNRIPYPIQKKLNPGRIDPPTWINHPQKFNLWSG